MGDDIPIFHPGHARCRARRAFGLVAFEPGAHGATPNYLDAIGLDKDAIGVYLSVAFERFPYFLPDLRGLCAA